MNANELASYIDHTLLKPEVTKEAIVALCQEAKDYHFKTVCVHPYWVKTAVKALEGTEVGVTTVIGFPHGTTTKEVKAFETEQAIQHGASDVDMVINVGALKSGLVDEVEEDIASVVKASNKRAVVKVIIETSQLTDEEKVVACERAVAAGADFVKTSTGFHTGGATLSDVRLMKETVGSNAKVKASGGVKNANDAKEYIDAGTDRIGTSSGIAIVSGGQSQSTY
ncbi:deoxyribose-phosphate aldolase [Geomicrobium sediminis]|uniref:Deoxyribose-phosphate aldolase n=1 Tax=Geomicrobium sediminis TaxID=1347788 RepID=A0ABS2P8W4_9BACL|nr:deoxyribose-phosphate aldolase [Geomicrobium sediminis]MBM7631852.1 deoxyribose-phosphate aldolase [Geomicrobium sediminis]